MSRFFLIAVGIAIFASDLSAQPGNLLRNGDFQDDWITHLPETKNHHWCFPSEFFHRRDFNPDAWFCKGNWEWRDADKPMGQRRLVLRGPGTEISQRVSWIAIHDDRQLEGFPDAGGFPVMKGVRSKTPERLIRDLTFRVRATGQDVPSDGGVLELALCPPGGTSTSDPMGTITKPVAAISVKLPEGTYAKRVIELKLPASLWLEQARKLADKNPTEAAEIAKAGPTLPACVTATLRYNGKVGSLELEAAELFSAESGAANLLSNGGFEEVDKSGYPVGWSQPIKYRYFPPRHYYIFNTWHNANFANRGFVALDALLPRDGKQSLCMVAPAGDEVAVLSDPIVLNQAEARLIEVSAWIKTDRLCMMQIDAVNEKGDRLDGFNFIHKAPVSIGTDSWRLVRQVFKPRAPVKSFRLALCARGVNGYTLDDTGTQPQNNVVGTIWWDQVHVSEPESTPAELIQRGIKISVAQAGKEEPHLVALDLGERSLGDNVLHASIVNVGAPRQLRLEWNFTAPSGKKSSFRSALLRVEAGKPAKIELPYTLTEPCPAAYSEYKGRLSLLDEKDQALAASDLWFGVWTTAIDLDLGALYLRPDQKQFVRMNLGFSHKTMSGLKTIKLEVVRRGNGEVLKFFDIDAAPAALARQREKIPAGLRDDFANLVLADLDVTFLPVQPFADPQRNWLVRATAIDQAGKVLGQSESPPFCRQGHEAPQPAIKSVRIKGDLVYVNDEPWLPFGVAYGHTPVYPGPADPGVGQYRDLRNLPGWSMYDRHNSESSIRKLFDFNCMRYVAGSITDPKILAKRWLDDNLYCSTAFAVPQPVFSLDELMKQAGGKDKLEAYLAACRASPAVVAVTPGIEEAFGLFTGATPTQLKGLGETVDHLRQKAGRPVMVGHGGYWNRLEFEKVPFFDIFDPETEPLYPANLHTDLAPLVRGKDKVIWLRPQMYESIPYERWRFHTFVELMRGCRGWQIAHGPGDASLFRGLHGEVEFWKPIVASTDPGPKVNVEPWLEHWSRGYKDKTYIIAASTHGIALGQWIASDDAPNGAAKSRITRDRHELRDESNAYAIGQKADTGPSIHGIQYLPDATRWPKGTTLVQWVKLDGKAMPQNLVLLAKGDGRWTHAASWGKTDLSPLRKDPQLAYWFLSSFYRHSKGFLGWGLDLVPKALPYIPDAAADMGPLPKADEWLKLSIPLEKLGVTDKLLDGVGFLHEGGAVRWGPTTIVSPDGKTKVIWGDDVALPQADLAKVKIYVAGLKRGAVVRVLFEDRTVTAEDGYFIDNFRGQDLYQRYGGGLGTGYGDAPVAWHLYEMRK